MKMQIQGRQTQSWNWQETKISVTIKLAPYPLNDIKTWNPSCILMLGHHIWEIHIRIQRQTNSTLKRTVNHIANNKHFGSILAYGPPEQQYFHSASTTLNPKPFLCISGRHYIWEIDIQIQRQKKDPETDRKPKWI